MSGVLPSITRARSQEDAASMFLALNALRAADAMLEDHY